MWLVYKQPLSTPLSFVFPSPSLSFLLCRNMLAMKTKMMFCTRCCVTKQEVEDTVIIQSGRPRHQTLKLHLVCAACLFLFTQWSPLRKGRMVQCVEYETKKPRRSIYTGSIPHNKKGKFPRPKTQAQYLRGFDSPQQKGIVSQTKNPGAVFTWVRFPTTKRDSFPDQKPRRSIYMGSIPHNQKG